MTERRQWHADVLGSNLFGDKTAAARTTNLWLEISLLGWRDAFPLCGLPITRKLIHELAVPVFSKLSDLSNKHRTFGR